ncbi:MAG: hypothetical protein ACYCZU_09795 [Devosia sp.]
MPFGPPGHFDKLLVAEDIDSVDDALYPFQFGVGAVCVGAIQVVQCLKQIRKDDLAALNGYVATTGKIVRHCAASEAAYYGRQQR